VVAAGAADVADTVTVVVGPGAVTVAVTVLAGLAPPDEHAARTNADATTTLARRMVTPIL
jgi:hypothetical protein